MNMAEIQKQFEDHVIANYTRIPVCVVRGEGSRVWDADGRSYLDLFPGWGVAGLGHCHPKVTEAICRQARKLIHVANNYYNEEQGEFAELLSTLSGGFKVFFCNSGAEANEGAIKLARLATQPKTRIISMENSFHGRTFGAISATGQPEYRKGFEPTVPDIVHARFNDLASVAELMADGAAAVIVEPVQGEGGVVSSTPEFLTGLRRLCDEKGALLIFDEVQTAPARLGTWFGFQHFGVTPDIITTAKAIAGGMPMGALLARPAVSEALRPGTHASTFGGHSLGCAAGIAGIKAMQEEDILGNVARMGKEIDGKLATISRLPGVKATRRVGFMVGIELDYPGAGVVSDCRNHGLLINCTHQTVLRLLPAMNIGAAELDEGLFILSEALTRAARRSGSIRILPTEAKR